MYGRFIKNKVRIIHKTGEEL